MRFTTLCGGLCQTALWSSSQSFLVQQVEFTGAPRTERVMPDHNTGNLMPYSLRIVCGFFNFPQLQLCDSILADLLRFTIQKARKAMRYER